MTAFIIMFIKETALADQKIFLDTLQKPFKVSVQALATRLKLINKFMRHFPGTAGMHPYVNNELKYLLYNCMLTEWKLEFAKSGQSLNNNVLEYRDLTNYFVVIERACNVKNLKRNFNHQGPLNKCYGGQGRFNRDQGRYNQGNSYGHGNGGSNNFGQG